MLHQGTDIYDLSNTVMLGQNYNLAVPMISPFHVGSYAELCQVARGGNQLCEFYVYVEVMEKRIRKLTNNFGKETELYEPRENEAPYKQLIYRPGDRAII